LAALNDVLKPLPLRLTLSAFVLVLLAACSSGSKPAAETPPVATATPELLATSSSSVRDLPPQTDAAPKAVIVPKLLPEPWAAAPLAKNDRIPAPPNNSAKAAVLVDEPSGAIIYEKNAHERLSPASLTKIVTLILALERGGLDEWVDIDVDSRTMRGSTVMGLIPGDRFRLRDLLYGLMLPSGNDAALAIGRYVSGSDAAFVDQMNLLSQRLGLVDTLWANPHGLGGGVTHYTSAYDLAMFSRYGMTLPGFREFSTAPYWKAEGNRVLEVSNINSFLRLYRGADGVKTGYTRSAGSTLSASAWRDGHRIFAVILNSPSREWDAIGLLDWAFNNHTWVKS
jgi:D-alanyl-D-alanine carboxypeptidase (penicillin-binding protein 5/6)